MNDQMKQLDNSDMEELLNSYLDGGDHSQDAGAQEETRKEFIIADDGRADWALRKIAEEKQEYTRIKELGEMVIAETEEKIAAAKKRYESSTSFLTSKLAQYFNTVLHKKTKTTETYRLLSGRLVLKLGKPKAAYDEEKLVQWLKDNGKAEYVKTEEKPKWGEFAKTLDLSNETAAVIPETGEIVDCITVNKTPDVFTVEV